MSTPLRLAVIQGSTREGRLGPTVAHWLAGHATDRPDLSVDVIDLAETPLPTVFPHLGQAPSGEADLALLRAVSPAWPPPTPSSSSRPSITTATRHP